MQKKSTSTQQNQRVVVSVCPRCHEPHKHAQTDVVRDIRDMKLLHSICHLCNAVMLTAELGGGAVVTSIGVLTDLQREEVETFWSSDSVQEQDVIALHELIQKTEKVGALLRVQTDIKKNN